MVFRYRESKEFVSYEFRTWALRKDAYRTRLSSEADNDLKATDASRSEVC